MSLALLVSGQGGQHSGMLAWLGSDSAAPDLLAPELAQISPRGWREGLDDPALAVKQRFAQPLLTATALAAWRMLAGQLGPPVAVAGYSVGEIAAYSIAGVFDESEAMALVRERAAAMEDAPEGKGTGLIGVSGLDAAGRVQVCAATGVQPAIELGADAAVLGGETAMIAHAGQHALDLGGRTTLLKVNRASHTRWMKGAADRFASACTGLRFQRPRIVLVTGTGGAQRDPARLRDLLVAQIHTTIQWPDVMEAVASRRPDCVLELGPCNALARRWHSLHPEIPARSVDEFRSVDAIVEWVRRHEDLCRPYPPVVPRGPHGPCDAG